METILKAIEDTLPPDINLVNHYELVKKGRFNFVFECDGLSKDMPLIVEDLIVLDENRINNAMAIHLEYLIKRFREGLL